MYGARGRIGLITLASDTSVLPEYTRVMPEGVAVYPAPIVLPRGEVNAAALAEMLAGDQLERAAELLVWAEVDMIVFACTTGSLVHGVGWDRELSAASSERAGDPRRRRRPRCWTRCGRSARPRSPSPRPTSTSSTPSSAGFSRRAVSRGRHCRTGLRHRCRNRPARARGRRRPGGARRHRRRPTRSSSPARISTACR